MKRKQMQQLIRKYRYDMEASQGIVIVMDTAVIADLLPAKINIELIELNTMKRKQMQQLIGKYRHGMKASQGIVIAMDT